MPSRYPTFDRTRLELLPLSERRNLLGLDTVMDLEDRPVPEDDTLRRIARSILAARERGSAVILMMGAHLLRAGVARYLIRMMENGWITHVAMNGAGPIHDFEMALIGATTESVADYIQVGQFGLWKETGRLNRIAVEAAAEHAGFGETIGKAIQEGDFPNRDISVLAGAYRLGVPATAHIGIGYDIIHEHPDCDGGAVGRASYHDFLVFAQSVTSMEGGVLLNFGTAVMGPEVFLKALSMARNVARQEGRQIRHFTTAVFDLVELGNDLDSEPPRGDPRYYFRPFKTLLVRTVRDGGESYYVRGEHRETFPGLYRWVNRLSAGG